MQDDPLGFLIGDCSRLLRKRFDASARALGVSRAQWQVLVALSRQEGTNQAGLAEYLEVETITLCRMVDRLQEAGLVERRADPADRRAWKLYLTEPAGPLLDQLRQIGGALVEEALNGISLPLRELLYDGLAALRNNLSARGPATLPDAPQQERA